MKAITNDFKETIKELKEITSKITYTIDGVATELGDEELNSVQPHYQGSLLKSVMKELDLDSNVEIPNGTIINYQFGVLVNNSYEYINYGNYVVYSNEKQEDTNSYLIKCYDKMLYSMVDYESFATYPITIREYLDALCTHLGLTFKNKNDDFTNYDRTIANELYLDENGNSLGYKFRDVLDELAQVTASTICINEDDDTLEIRYITNAGETTTNVNGTSLSITSEDSKVNEIKLLGNTTQASTPTPSSPQEVKTVTGLQQVKAVGKNLLNLNRILGTPSNTASANTTKRTFNYNQYVLGISANNYYYPTYIANATIENDKITIKNTNGAYGIGLPLKVETNTTYKLNYSTSASANQNVGVGYYSSDGTFISYLVSTGTNNYLDITTPNNCDFMVIIFKPTANTEITYSNIQLEKGSTATTYEPYQEQVSEINLGKNLYEGSQDFSGTWEYGSSWETDSQTFNGCVVKKRAGSWNGINKTFPVVSGKTYTFSVYAKADESRNCGLYLSNSVTPVASTISVTTEWQRYSITFTANSNSTVRPRIENQTNSSTNYTYIACFQLERGTQATSYSEYFTPIELCKIGTYEDKIFKTSGKNLFDKDNANVLNGYVNYNTGVFTSPNANNQKCFYIKVEPSTTYTWSGYTTSASVGYGLFTNVPNINDTANSYGQITSSKTITTGANDNYLVMFYTALNTSVDVSSFQLEKNSSATEYEPYSNNEWYVKKAIGKVVLTGANTEDWTYAGTSTSGTYRLKNNDISALVKKPSANNIKIPLYSNYYKDATADNTYLLNVGVSIATNGGIYIYDSNYTTSNVSLYKTWLSTHNTIVYYPLASPTYEKLNDTLQEELNSIRLLEGLNNISTNVPIDLTYVSEIDTIDEEYFNQDNVNFGEIYGPVNTIILSRSAESDEIAQSIPSNLSDDEKVAIKISDNQIMNFDNRDEFLYGILTRLYGLRYVQNDYSSKGICYYDLCDRYRADIFGKSYYCVMLNDDVTIESGLSENVFTEIPDTAKTEYSNTTTTDRLERRTTLIVDKQVGEIRAEISTIDDQLNGANGVTSKLNAQGQTLDIWSKSFDENGNVIALNTTNYTFDNEGLRIGKSTDDYNSLQDNTGTYYYEKDTMTGKYTKDGSVQKDLALFGTYYYGIDEENFNVATFTRDDALFIAQLYEKTYTDKNGNQVTKNAVGHFYNGR